MKFPIHSNLRSERFVMSLLCAFNRAIEITAKGLSLSLAALITLFVFVSVISRNFFSYSFEYSVDANQLMFMWMCFMGLVVVHYNGTMLKFEMLEQRIPSDLRCYWTGILHLLVMAVAAVMIWGGYAMLDFAKAQRFSTMSVSYFWMYLPVPLAGSFILLQAFEKLVNVWRKGQKSC